MTGFENEVEIFDKAHIILEDIVSKIVRTPEEHNDYTEMNSMHEGIDVTHLEDVKGVPDLWNKSIFRNEMILSLVREHDMPLMDHITNLEVSKANEETEGSKSSATATISFSENEYFSNATLTLKVYFEDADALSEESEPVKIVGDEILWKDGKCLTKVKTTKKQKNKKTGETRNVTKTVKQESFFNIYTSFDVPK